MAHSYHDLPHGMAIDHRFDPKRHSALGIFPCSITRRDPELSMRMQSRRRQAEATAEDLLRGGLADEEVYAAKDGDTIFDLESGGLRREYLGRQRRRWSGFADQAHISKTSWGREYERFRIDKGIVAVTQVVLRKAGSVVPVGRIREIHAQLSRKLNDQQRYGRMKIAPGFICDMVSAELSSAASGGQEVDLHFHLMVRASRNDILSMRTYFERNGWIWWDSMTSQPLVRGQPPIALAQYISKGIAAAIHDPVCPEFAFTATNLRILHDQTTGLAMTRAIGDFRIWKAQQKHKRAVSLPDKSGSRMCSHPKALARRRNRQRLNDSIALQVLRFCLHDFGDGVVRRAVLVRGSSTVTFDEVRNLLASIISQENTTITESQDLHQPSVWKNGSAWGGDLHGQIFQVGVHDHASSWSGSPPDNTGAIRQWLADRPGGKEALGVEAPAEAA